VAVTLFCVLLYGPFGDVVAWFPVGLQPTVAAIWSDPRIVAARVAVRMFFASPLLGTGLDTFDHVFPRFHPAGTTLFYAHNDYAQLLAESGAVGATLAVGLATVLLIRGRRFYTLVPPSARLLEAGPWAALAGIAAHAAFDWNLRVPANAIMAACIAGLCAATGGRSVPQSTSMLTRIARVACAAVCVGAAVIVFATLARDAVSETVQRELRTTLTHARLAKDNEARLAVVPDLTSAVEAGDRMAAWDTRDSELFVLIGQAHLHLADLTTNGIAARHSAATTQAFEQAQRTCAMLRGTAEPATATAPK
jgi:hypothetical protein